MAAVVVTLALLCRVVEWTLHAALSISMHAPEIVTANRVGILKLVTLYRNYEAGGTLCAVRASQCSFQGIFSQPTLDGSFNFCNGYEVY